MLDQIDLKILRALQANGRLSNQDLADQVALSPSACLRRVKTLEQEGYIVATMRCSTPPSWATKSKPLCKCA